MNPELITPLVLTVIALLGFSAGVGLYHYLVKLRYANPDKTFEARIATALMPYVHHGILIAYKAAEQAMDQFDQRIKGLEKKEIALAVYDVLPDRIGPFSVTLVKRYISREQFGELIEIALQQAGKMAMQHERRFSDLYARWISEHPLENFDPYETQRLKWPKK